MSKLNENSFIESLTSTIDEKEYLNDTPSIQTLLDQNTPKKTLKPNDNDTWIFFNTKQLDQLKNVEAFLWNYKSNQQVSTASIFDVSKQLIPTDILLEILSKSKCRKKIYDYFQLTQFQNCCTILKNFYQPFDSKLKINIIEDEEVQDTPIPDLFDDSIDEESIHENKLVLYYCTLCALYPNLYSLNLPSPVHDDLDYEMDELNTNTAYDDLETTSEGLCDHIREIFDIKRQVYNEYQIKAMKKLLTKKSHPQILKEELITQKYVLEHDLHPYYKKENFQTETCYEYWKKKKLADLSSMIEKFDHVGSDEPWTKKDRFDKYVERLNNFPGYYERLVQQVFKNLTSNNGFRLTSNSKRLLKEFQLRYCVDTFEGLVIEMKFFIKFFQNSFDIFEVLVSYIRYIHDHLQGNKIPNESQRYSVPLPNLLELISILENTSTVIGSILRDLKLFNPDACSKKLTSLLQLMEEVSLLNDYLNRTSSISVTDSIKVHIKIGLEILYSNTKRLLASESKMDSNLVYSMLFFVKDQVNYYKKGVFQKFFKSSEVLTMVIEILYTSLMNDVKSLFEDHFEELYDQSMLNMNLLALAYRLNQFDSEFNELIPLEKQVWRSFISPHLYNWVSVIGKISSQMIHKYFIPRENFKEIEIKSDEYDPDYFTSLQDVINLTAKDFFDNIDPGTPFILSTEQSAFTPISRRTSQSTEKSIDRKRPIFKKKIRQQQSRESISIESNTDSILTKTTIQSEIVIKDRLPCSYSLTDLCILLFRYEDTCQGLLDLCIPFVNKKNFFQMRFNSINILYQQEYNFIEVYANNILALDLCALNKSYLEKFFGQDVKKEILSGKLDNSIWGCRHKLRNSKYKCNHFIDKKSKYISEKYEPINEEMCIRLNNILQLGEIQKRVYTRYNHVTQRYYNQLLKINDRQALNLFQQFKFEVYKIKVLNKNMEKKLELIKNGLTSLLVYRFNLFCKKALFFLVSDELGQYPLIIRMKPLIDFITCNFNMLKNKLYPKIFEKFVKTLWNSFYENFFELVKKFEEESSIDTQKMANLYSKIINILTLKFKEYIPNHVFLESRMKQINVILHLYSQNTNSLIFLHYKLFNFNYQKNERNQFDLIHLVKMAKKLKKSFNGKFFIKFLKKNPPLLNHQESKDFFINYAQRLLEEDYLCSIKAKSKSKGDNQVLSGFDIDKIYLATKTHCYRLNIEKISKLTEDLLVRNVLINQEIEVLYPELTLINSKHGPESDGLLNKCIENEITDQDFVLRILWHRIYDEPIVMKFISMRHSNYANNQFLNKIMPRRVSNEIGEINFPFLHLF